MIQPMLIDGFVDTTVSTALISPCGNYRYRLTRIWDATKPRMVFVMLNPSTADASVNDPTIVRCIKRAQREGCGSIDVVNLFALRSTDPKLLKLSADPVGPENDFHLLAVLDPAPRFVVAAWGAHTFAAERSKAVQELLRQPLRDIRRGLTCLGTTQAGHPRHPLYVSAKQPLVLLRSTK